MDLHARAREPVRTHAGARVKDITIRYKSDFAPYSVLRVRLVRSNRILFDMFQECQVQVLTCVSPSRTKNAAACDRAENRTVGRQAGCDRMQSHAIARDRTRLHAIARWHRSTALFLSTKGSHRNS